jgi:predicted phage terminase large subunit-like protein
MTRETAMSDRSIAQYREIVRTDLCGFIIWAFLQLNPATKFLYPPYLEILVDRLERVRRGEIKRLIVNLPPRSLKSHCVSVAFPAWLLGHTPSAQIICASYGQDLADKFARDCKSLMTSTSYEALFPTRLSQKQATAEFETTGGGCRLSTSVDGGLTGRGADFIIVDDVHKPEEAVSVVSRHAVKDWYASTLYSRLNDKTKGAIVVVQQRVHEDDLVGHLLHQKGWEVLSLPAIAERDEVFEAMTPYGKYRYRRKAGEALHPEREPVAALEAIRQAIGSYNFAAQYLQSPEPPGGGMIKEAWFSFYDRLPDKFDAVLQSWDTANVAGDLSSFSVGTTWGTKADLVYLLDVFRQRLNYPDLKRAVRERAKIFRADVILIEHRASGVRLYQELAREGIRGITKYEPEGEKSMRMFRHVAFIESGAVNLPRQAPWLPDYLHELLTFPHSIYDDQLDSTSQALDWIQRQGRCSGWVEYYGRLAAHARGLPLDDEVASIKYVRMRAHPNLGYQGSTGGRPWNYIANAEGIIEKVHPLDVERLQRFGCGVIEEAHDETPP